MSAVLAVLGYGLVYPVCCSQVVLLRLYINIRLKGHLFSMWDQIQTLSRQQQLDIQFLCTISLKTFWKTPSSSQFPVRASSERGVKIKVYYCSFILQWFTKSPLPVIVPGFKWQKTSDSGEAFISKLTKSVDPNTPLAPGGRMEGKR